MTSKYFGVPFANAGDKTSIPDASQPSGDVSFQDGWTPDYAKDQATDATAKDVSRQSENYFKFTVTEALKEIQEIGAKPYDALVNYPIGAVIPGSDNVRYECQIPNGPATTPVNPVGDLTPAWIKYLPAIANLISGLTPSNNSGSPNTHIDISAGLAIDSGDTIKLQLKAPLTKDLSKTFVAGTGNGGLYTSGGLSINTDYYGFVIKKDSDASIDVYYDISISAANIPAGYTAYRLIDAFLSSSAGFIFSYTAKEIAGNVYKEFADIYTLLSGSTVIGRQLLTCNIPAGLESVVHINVYLKRDTAACAVWIRSTAFPNVTPSLGPQSDLGVRNATDSLSFIYKDVLSDVSSQIAYRSSVAGETFIMTQAGYTLIRN